MGNCESLNIFTSSSSSKPSSSSSSPALDSVTPRQRALLIGINYLGQAGELRGCANDVLHMWRYLRDVRGVRDVVVLSDGIPDEGWDADMQVESPTREALLRELGALVGWARAGDRCWFHYSGHGGKLADAGEDEADGFDECLFPVDFRQEGIVKDDHIQTCIKRLHPEATFVGVIDACHSGTMLDLAHTYVPGNKGPNILKNHYPQIFSISGCRDDQTSADALLQGRWGGALTTMLLRLLEENRDFTCRELHAALHANLEVRYLKQRPQLQASAPLRDGTVVPI